MEKIIKEVARKQAEVTYNTLLLKEMLPIAEKMGRRYGDDAISAARCCLIEKVMKGVEHPNPKGYLITCMKGAIKNHLSRRSIVRVPRSEYETARVESVTLENLVPRQSKSKPSDMLYSELKRLLNHHEMFIIECRLQGMTYEEIGQVLGRNKQYAQREHKKIAEKVRELIG